LWTCAHQSLLAHMPLGFACSPSNRTKPKNIVKKVEQRNKTENPRQTVPN